MSETWTLFFDGDCAFCSQSVQRVVALDKRGRIFFSPLQGQLAREMNLGHHATKGAGTMVVLRESDGKIFLRSAALIELAHALGGPWQLATAARFIPVRLRDFVYNLIARNRARLASQATCNLPTPELLARLRK